MNINLKELRELSCAALGGPMVEWPSKWQPWWKDPRIRRSAIQALQDALSPDVMLALLDRLEAAEAVVERVKDKSRFYLEGGFLEDLQRELLEDAAQEEQL